MLDLHPYDTNLPRFNTAMKVKKERQLKQTGGTDKRLGPRNNSRSMSGNGKQQHCIKELSAHSDAAVARELQRFVDPHVLQAMGVPRDSFYEHSHEEEAVMYRSSPSKLSEVQKRQLQSNLRE